MEHELWNTILGAIKAQLFNPPPHMLILLSMTESALCTNSDGMVLGGSLAPR